MSCLGHSFVCHVWVTLLYIMLSVIYATVQLISVPIIRSLPTGKFPTGILFTAGKFPFRKRYFPWTGSDNKLPLVFFYRALF